MAFCVMPRSRAITLHCVNGQRLTWDDNGADNGGVWIRVMSSDNPWAEISRHTSRPIVRPPRECKFLSYDKPVRVKPLMLTPVTVREVERNLLLWRTGRAAIMNNRRTTRPMRMLTRLVESGYEVVASHVLTILGGPMELMVDWGDTRRRPCLICFKIDLHWSQADDSAILGSVENYRAIENSRCAFAYPTTDLYY